MDDDISNLAPERCLNCGRVVWVESSIEALLDENGKRYCGQNCRWSALLGGGRRPGGARARKMRGCVGAAGAVGKHAGAATPPQQQDDMPVVGAALPMDIPSAHGVPAASSPMPIAAGGNSPGDMDNAMYAFHRMNDNTVNSVF